MTDVLNTAGRRKPRANSIPVWFWIVTTVVVASPVALFIYATTDHPAAAPRFAEIEFDRIAVDRNWVEDQQRVTISDPATIQGFRAILNSLDSGWYVSPDETPAVLDFHISLMSASDSVAHLSISSTVVTFGSGRKRDLNVDEWEQLQRILGLPSDRVEDETEDIYPE